MFGKHSHEESAYHRLSALFDSMTLNEWSHRVRRGLRQPRDTGEYAWARAQRRRILAPVLALLMPLLLVTLVVVLSRHAGDRKDTTSVTYVEDPVPPALDPVPLAPPLREDTLPDVLPAVSDTAPSFSDPSPIPVGLTTSFISPVPSAIPTAAAMRGSITFNPLIHTRSDEGREEGLARFNAAPGTHDAILRAMRWLKLHQHPDGWWAPCPKTERSINVTVMTMPIPYAPRPCVRHLHLCINPPYVKRLDAR